MTVTWFLLGVIAVGGLVIAPVAHWRSWPDAAFPLWGLSRTGWKMAWLLAFLTGTVPILGAMYWTRLLSGRRTSEPVERS
jgi:hypothetical protein